ncbi:NAD(P)-dependent glycerol-3-phosphate dehydrogenase [Candidatus Bipolaricaulota bacterium]|nr:NAD(P)-dependent glycerol-3-phosphate dehydrogenase [Candidatus Bipolaricaulota bacterium]
MKFAVLGAGGWGTAVARLLSNQGHDTVLWARDPDRASQIDRDRCNDKYLPGINLPGGLLVTADLGTAMASDVLVLGVPSIGMPELLTRISSRKPSPPVIVNLAKGMNRTTHQTMSELISEALPQASVFTLSGPSHAEEVGRDMPTAVVLAGTDLDLGQRLQEEIATARFRVYLSEDIRGVETCSTIKNVIALATGISDGLGYGDNTRGALITRGLAEMVRFGRVFNVQEATFYGLSGLGDLVATCTSRHSRNRAVGVRLGQGESLAAIMKDMSMVAEGIFAADIVYDLACENSVEMPITSAVYRMLRSETNPHALVTEIMTRSPKREDC